MSLYSKALAGLAVTIARSPESSWAVTSDELPTPTPVAAGSTK